MKAALAALRYMLDNGADEKLLQEVRLLPHSDLIWVIWLDLRLILLLWDEAWPGRCRAAPLARRRQRSTRPARRPWPGARPAAPRLRTPQGAQLAQACLAFDFVGTLLDDSAEDVTTIQVRTRPPPSTQPTLPGCTPTPGQHSLAGGGLLPR